MQRLRRQAHREHREFLGVKSAYVTFTFQKIGALNLRMSRTFFRKAVGWEPLSPRHVCHFAESDFLDLAGELLAFRLIGRAHPVRLSKSSKL